MKKLFSILLVIVVLSMIAAPVVLAQARPGTEGLPQTGTPTSGDDVVGLIGDIGNWIFVIFMAISVIYILLGAFQFITAGGDPTKLSEARQKLIFAAIGIAISLLAGSFETILRSVIIR